LVIDGAGEMSEKIAYHQGSLKKKLERGVNGGSLRKRIVKRPNKYAKIYILL
jgi:hypothetical protein